MNSNLAEAPTVADESVTVTRLELSPEVSAGSEINADRDSEDSSNAVETSLPTALDPLKPTPVRVTVPLEGAKLDGQFNRVVLTKLIALAGPEEGDTRTNWGDGRETTLNDDDTVIPVSEFRREMENTPIAAIGGSTH